MIMFNTLTFEFYLNNSSLIKVKLAIEQKTFMALMVKFSRFYYENSLKKERVVPKLYPIEQTQKKKCHL